MLVVGVLAAGFAWHMAAQPSPLVSAASAATIPQAIAKSIGSDPHAPVAGNPLGSVTVSEFFDYRCPYCRMMQPTLDALVAKDRRVRLVAKEWPIFGGPSVTAARIALAARWQGKYAAVHDALFKLPHTMDEESIRTAAASAGVDMLRLDRDLASRGKEIDAELATVDREARSVGFQGTGVRHRHIDRARRDPCCGTGRHGQPGCQELKRALPRGTGRWRTSCR